jgi:hypothetical protein
MLDSRRAAYIPTRTTTIGLYPARTRSNAIAVQRDDFTVCNRKILIPGRWSRPLDVDLSRHDVACALCVEASGAGSGEWGVGKKRWPMTNCPIVENKRYFTARVVDGLEVLEVRSAADGIRSADGGND